MMVTNLDQSITRSKVVPYLFVAALSSLVTSWAFHTPELDKKAATLELVEHKTLPDTLGKLAKTQTDLKQANCDRNKFVSLAAQGIEANNDTKVDAPDWSDLKGCPKVSPVKPPPVSAVVPKVDVKS